MSRNNNHPVCGAPWYHIVLSTGFGTGFFPGAPGTAGAFFALFLWFGLYLVVPASALFWVMLVLVVVTTVVGAWTSDIMENYWGEDPRTVVIDEFVGTWIPCTVAAVAGAMWQSVILGFFGFATFRIIDIIKTPLCRRLESIPHGWGVMLDDVVAGIYALILTLVLRYYITGSAFEGIII